MKVYLAGMESILTSYKTFNLKPDDNIFGTFFYESNTTRMLEILRERGGHKGIVTIDSGAHTFFGQAGVSAATHHTNTKKKMQDPHKYIDRYFEWIKEHWDQISYFVELDIQSILGLDQVKKWRKRMQSEGIYKKCITVYHSVDTWEDYVEMLDTSESMYVGLEGLRAKKRMIPYVKSLKAAYERGIKVHGFALTNMSTMKNFPFYSVDSTTWTSCVRYGSFIQIDRHGELRQKIPTKANYFADNIPVDLIAGNKSVDSSTKKLEHSAQKFREIEKIMTDLWVARGIKWKD